MATIKEKAHEIGWEYSKNYDPVACRQEWCEMAARESANYVLEQIEQLTDNQNWCAFPKQSHKELKELIEQLKK